MEILVVVFALALGVLIGFLWARSQVPRAEVEGRVADQAVVREGLARLHDQLRDLEAQRLSWQSQLGQQVVDMRLTAESLRRETNGLATALRKPQVRGRWGELHLRRAVEIAGMVDQCDFTEQSSFDTADGRQRPDLVVRLAGGKHVVVDSKVPLDAFLDATSTDDPDSHDQSLARHARQVRSHVDALGAKRYWRLVDSPEFVVMFVPGDSFLAAALDADHDLLDYAMRKQVVIATPTTLIALLRTVALGWQHESVAETARDIHALGQELHERLGLMGSHLDRLGKSLGNAVAAYNQTLGSLESRVLVTARKFETLSPGSPALASPSTVETAPRAISASELLTG